MGQAGPSARCVVFLRGPACFILRRARPWSLQRSRQRPQTDTWYLRDSASIVACLRILRVGWTAFWCRWASMPYMATHPTTLSVPVNRNFCLTPGRALVSSKPMTKPNPHDMRCPEGMEPVWVWSPGMGFYDLRWGDGHPIRWSRCYVCQRAKDGVRTVVFDGEPLSVDWTVQQCAAAVEDFLLDDY